MHAQMKATVLAASLTTAALGLPAVAAAQVPDTNERTKITIDAPLEIPKTTLAPGTYWFELVESKADQHTVRIQNQDQSETIATLIAVPIYRQLNETKGETQLVLTGTGAGAALDAWFFPGKQYGHQFVYPKEQARQIAERNKHVVLADEDGKIVRMNAGNISEPWAPDHNGGDRTDTSNTARANSSDRKSSDAKTSDMASANRNAADTRSSSASAPAAAASSQAVGTSGSDRRESDTSSMDAEQHLDALSDLIDKALAGNGATVSIDRSTLQQMKSHVQQLKASHDKK